MQSIEIESIEINHFSILVFDARNKKIGCAVNYRQHHRHYRDYLFKELSDTVTARQPLILPKIFTTFWAIKNKVEDPRLSVYDMCPQYCVSVDWENFHSIKRKFHFRQPSWSSRVFRVSLQFLHFILPWFLV